MTYLLVFLGLVAAYIAGVFTSGLAITEIKKLREDIALRFDHLETSIRNKL